MGKAPWKTPSQPRGRVDAGTASTNQATAVIFIPPVKLQDRMRGGLKWEKETALGTRPLSALPP